MSTKAKKIQKQNGNKKNETRAERVVDVATEPAKKKYKNPYECKKIEIDAEVPGVGTIKVSLIEVEHNGTKFRCTTRKEAIDWLRNKRAEERKIKSANRDTKNAERLNKSFPMVTERISSLAQKIAKLAECQTVNQDEKDILNKAAELLVDCAIIRNVRGQKEKEAVI